MAIMHFERYKPELQDLPLRMGDKGEKERD